MLSMMQKSFICSVLTALVYVSSIVASHAEENYDLFKYGSLSCDEWIRHSTLTEAETPKWFSDYLKQLYQSGGYRVDIMNQFKQDQIVTWLDSYCRGRPLDGLAVAGTVLTNDLAERAIAKK